MLKPNSLTAYISWLGLIGLIILVTTTSPVDKISYAMLFFGLLLLFFWFTTAFVVDGPN